MNIFFQYFNNEIDKLKICHILNWLELFDIYYVF